MSIVIQTEEQKLSAVAAVRRHKDQRLSHH
jgi:hypothetical protein